MSEKAYVAGVGMIPFVKPGENTSYDDMGAEAIRIALKDAGIDYKDVKQAYAGYVYGDTGCGQQTVYQVGCTGIPVINVSNACASGSTALFLARQAVESGAVDVALAVGFEEMRPGALGFVWGDRKPIMEKHSEIMKNAQELDEHAPIAAQWFGGAGREYLEKYDAHPEIFARVSVKARQHAANNKKALFRAPITVEEVMKSPHLYGPLTRLMACPPTCGAAAAIIVSEEYARRNGIQSPVEIVAQSMATDPAESFAENSMMNLVGHQMAKKASNEVYEKAGIGPEDVDVVELHDCFSSNEVLAYEGLGLAAEGEASKFILDGQNTYGGSVVTNPSGGLLSKGHPLGATGLAQCTELVEQLRGIAGQRQVDGAKIGLQHNLGLGGACVITMYRLANNL